SRAKLGHTATLPDPRTLAAYWIASSAIRRIQTLTSSSLSHLSLCSIMYGRNHKLSFSAIGSNRAQGIQHVLFTFVHWRTILRPADIVAQIGAAAL
ncbi:MAG TPA: hypothetical protein VJP02_25850, partial [Candidatus Sulfotelmatobacter sp.]|nr:hypothetical protein [Candidatus Sulfotelmatobacter sp.]